MYHLSDITLLYRTVPLLHAVQLHVVIIAYEPGGIIQDLIWDQSGYL